MSEKSAKILRQKIAVKARDDIDVFIEFVFRLKQSQCHRDVQAHLASGPRQGITAQRDLGKTTQALCRAIWRLGKNPNLLVKIVCASDELAADRIVYIRDVIDRNKRLRLVFPELRKSPHIDDWGKHSLTVNRSMQSKDSSVESYGVLTSGTGGRADLVIFDDIVDLLNAVKYPERRKLVKKAFKNTWLGLLGPQGEAWYLATPYHDDDNTANLQKNKKWNFIDFSVTGDPPVSRWPEKWTKKALMDRFEELGSIDFDQMYRGILHPDSERIVHLAWIRRFSRHDVPDRGDYRAISYDWSTGSENSDRQARAIMDGFFQEKVIRVRSIDQYKDLTFNKMIEMVLRDIDFYQPQKVVIEQGGFQTVMARDERVMHLHYIEKYVPKVSKRERLKQTAVLYENGIIEFDDERCEKGIAEVLGFPKMKYDDMMDALTQGVLHVIEKVGRPFNPGDASSKGGRVFVGPGNVEATATARSAAESESGRTRFGKRVGFRSMKW